MLGQVSAAGVLTFVWQWKGEGGQQTTRSCLLELEDRVNFLAMLLSVLRIAGYPQIQTVELRFSLHCSGNCETIGCAVVFLRRIRLPMISW